MGKKLALEGPWWSRFETLAEEIATSYYKDGRTIKYALKYFWIAVREYGERVYLTQSDKEYISAYLRCVNGFRSFTSDKRNEAIAAGHKGLMNGWNKDMPAEAKNGLVLMRRATAIVRGVYENGLPKKERKKKEVSPSAPAEYEKEPDRIVDRILARLDERKTVVAPPRDTSAYARERIEACARAVGFIPDARYTVPLLGITDDLFEDTFVEMMKDGFRFRAVDRGWAVEIPDAIESRLKEIRATIAALSDEVNELLGVK